jgi:hypothetical protein
MIVTAGYQEAKPDVRREFRIVLKTFAVSFFILFIVHEPITRHLAAIAKTLSGYDPRRPPGLHAAM